MRLSAPLEPPTCQSSRPWKPWGEKITYIYHDKQKGKFRYAKIFHQIQKLRGYLYSIQNCLILPWLCEKKVSLQREDPNTKSTASHAASPGVLICRYPGVCVFFLSLGGTSTKLAQSWPCFSRFPRKTKTFQILWLVSVSKQWDPDQRYPYNAKGGIALTCRLWKTKTTTPMRKWGRGIPNSQHPPHRRPKTVRLVGGVRL